jgi:RNA polymerase-binding transcription factor DksA
MAGLQEQKASLEDRIKRIERDLKLPLDQDPHEQANELSQQLVLRSLLETERSNLRKIKSQIENLGHF